MRDLLKASAGGAYAALGGLRRLHTGKLVVLTFHRVRPGGEAPHERAMRTLDVAVADFRRILIWMKARYAPLALGDWLDSPKPLARSSFAVTFDDGWADNFQHAFPVLRELGIPATIFLATGAVEERTPFWWQMPGLSDAEIEHIKNEPGRGPDWKSTGQPEQRQLHAEDFLTWDQIHEMGRSGMVTFGPHGHCHALLDRVARDEAVADIRRSWDLLRERVPEAFVPLLAWPNGNARDDAGEELAAMGLKAAFGTRVGAVGDRDDARWNLPRNNIDRRLSQLPRLWPWMLMRAR